MNAFQGKKPFYKKTFYLDLKGYKQETELVRNLKRLGGKQESFLSKEVSFVITSGVHSKNDSLIYPTPNSSAYSISASTPFNGSVVKAFDSPPYTSSPVPDENIHVSAPLSRGLSFIQKATQKKQGTTDVLEVCKQWKIKVIPLQKVLLWLSKYKNLCQRKNDPNKKACKTIDGGLKLQKPFLKIEDCARKFKTRYKLFNSLTFDQDLQNSIRRICSQGRVSKALDFDSTSVSPVLKERNGQVFQKNPKPSIFQRPICRSTTPSVATASGQFNINPYASTQLSTADKRRDHNISMKENVKRPEKNCQKKYRKRYCEICSSYFTQLDDHLQTQSHKGFFKDKSNFTILREIVTDLPNLDQFVMKASMVCNQSTTIRTNDKSLLDSELLPILVPHDTTAFESHTASPDMPELEAIEEMVESGTEAYSVVDEYISGTYSSPHQSSAFPFLEDTLDCLHVNVRNSTVPLCQEIDQSCDVSNLEKEPVVENLRLTFEGCITPESEAKSEYQNAIIAAASPDVFGDKQTQNNESQKACNQHCLASEVLLCNESYQNCETSQANTGLATHNCQLSFEACIIPELEARDETHNHINVIPDSLASKEEHINMTWSSVNANLEAQNYHMGENAVDISIADDKVFKPQNMHMENFGHSDATNLNDKDALSKEHPKPNFATVSYNTQINCIIGNLQPVDFSINCENTNNLSSVKDDGIHLDNNVFEANVPVASSVVCKTNNLSLVDEGKNFIFSEAVELVKDMYFSSGCNQIQAVSTVKCGPVCQSDGLDILSSSSDYNIWESIQTDVDSLCKSLGEDETVALDLSINKN